MFNRAEMQQYVDYIDAHLRHAPTLSAMALTAALSPSHFAKKFRQSTGLSLQRFINRRRLLAAIAHLQSNSDTLAGVTPAEYRKQFRR